MGPKKGLRYAANKLQRWGTILLNYNFRMKFLSSSKVCHVDGFEQSIPKNSELIPKNSEPLEDMVISSLRLEVEIKNTMLYCAGTTYDIGRNKKDKALHDNFILEMKKKTKRQEYNRIRGIFNLQ